MGAKQTDQTGRPELLHIFTITFRLFINPIDEEHDIINYSNDPNENLGKE
jgi:hypothetical protein